MACILNRVYCSCYYGVFSIVILLVAIFIAGMIGQLATLGKYDTQQREEKERGKTDETK